MSAQVTLTSQIFSSAGDRGIMHPLCSCTARFLIDRTGFVLAQLLFLVLLPQLFPGMRKYGCVSLLYRRYRERKGPWLPVLGQESVNFVSGLLSSKITLRAANAESSPTPNTSRTITFPAGMSAAGGFC